MGSAARGTAPEHPIPQEDPSHAPIRSRNAFRSSARVRGYAVDNGPGRPGGVPCRHHGPGGRSGFGNRSRGRRRVVGWNRSPRHHRRAGPVRVRRPDSRHLCPAGQPARVRSALRHDHGGCRGTPRPPLLAGRRRDPARAHHGGGAQRRSGRGLSRGTPVRRDDTAGDRGSSPPRSQHGRPVGAGWCARTLGHRDGHVGVHGALPGDPQRERRFGPGFLSVHGGVRRRRAHARPRGRDLPDRPGIGGAIRSPQPTPRHHAVRTGGGIRRARGGDQAGWPAHGTPRRSVRIRYSQAQLFAGAHGHEPQQHP